MFFKKKKEAGKPEAAEKKELLYKENIRVGCKPDTQENVIRAVGQMLVDTGYVDQPYVEAMLEREKSFSTYMGNELALPHGVEAAKKEIKASGIAVMIFPEGTQWGKEKAKIVIGIAGVGEEHLQILGVIADKMLVPNAAEELVKGDVDTVYRVLSGKE
ncbi:MAG: PTS sugar transporter subunit IIA [Eubacteriales bacterium]|nr:PTS sugar transporter subunit IIA [Eubacteriales bacterium]